MEKVDFGLGAADYKERFGDECWLEKDYYIFAPGFRGVMLNAVISGGFFAEKAARWLVAKAGPISRIKQLWRRRLVASDTKPEADNA